MQLRVRGVYRFDEATASLYRGLELIADRTLYGYALYTATEWDAPWSDPHFVVDARGRILSQGAWTGYTVEELVPVLATSGAPVPGHRPLDRFARHRRRGQDAPRPPPA